VIQCPRCGADVPQRLPTDVQLLQRELLRAHRRLHRAYELMEHHGVMEKIWQEYQRQVEGAA